MSYDERLARRVHEILPERPGLTEKKMFGGLAFMLNKNMCCGVIKEEGAGALAGGEKEYALDHFVSWH